MGADWAELHPDLLAEIARRIRLWEDFVSFRWVCRSWKSVAVEYNFKYKSLQIPWLLLPPKKCSDVRDFFLLSKGMSRQVILREANGKKWYSSKGWLITIAQDWSISLLHPFSHIENKSDKPHIQIKLPHMKTFKNWLLLSTKKMYVFFIDKFILSANPLLTSEYTLMVIYGGTRKLAYFRPGDKVWNILDTARGRVWDATYYNGRFYAINTIGQLKAYHISSHNISTTELVVQLPLHPVHLCLDKTYVVESGGALLVISREGWRAHKTLRFEVFEVDISTKTWREVKNLGNRALFLGQNSSLSVEASEASGCKPNCIYFTDDCVEDIWNERNGGGKDMGVYDMENDSIKPFFMGNSYNRVNPPMWVEQTF